MITEEKFIELFDRYNSFNKDTLKLIYKYLKDNDRLNDVDPVKIQSEFFEMPMEKLARMFDVDLTGSKDEIMERIRHALPHKEVIGSVTQTNLVIKEI